MLKTYLTVMLGGALGTGLRMAISVGMAARFGETFPIGTLVVNVTGCFLIGLFAAFTSPEGAYPVSNLMRQFVMIGIMGGYTTFSSFGLQTLYLLQRGDWLRAGLNSGLSLFLCLIAVWLGHLCATVLQPR